MWKCEKCGHKNSDNYDVCEKCNAERSTENKDTDDDLNTGTVRKIPVIVPVLLSIILVMAAVIIWMAKKDTPSVYPAAQTPAAAGQNAAGPCANGHVWLSATCTAPKTCNRCGKTEGSALGHSWLSATCTAPKTCIRCGKTEGSALGHSWQAATYFSPERCSRCWETRGSVLTPTPTPSNKDKELVTTGKTKSTKDINLQYPSQSDRYSEPFSATIKASKENGQIYIMPTPKSGNGNLGTVNNGTIVTIWAKRGGYYFFETPEGVMGWNGTVYFTVN